MLKPKTYILPETISNGNVQHSNIAIVINLYYIDSLQLYIKYIKSIPSYIHIFIYSSSLEVLECLQETFSDKDNIIIEHKENRGRDISTLLVAFKDRLTTYDYLCFLHDKREKYNFMRSDLNLWNRNLWDNMVKSDEYICNVINLLNEGNIGLLVPPKPIGEYMDFWYTNPWNDNFEVILNLAEKIGLECEVKYDDWDMVTLGTVFWCRTKALRKLFDYNWEYTDFPGEPMPDDGTISHAIERILGFVSVDAGYEVGTVMCSEYASDLNEMIQSKMQSTYKWLWHRVGIKNSFQLDRFDDEKATVDNMFSEFDRIYLYGAGHYGQIYLDRLSKWGYKPYGFVVSDGLRDSDIYLGYRVYELHEITQTDNSGIIICTNPELQEKLANYLRDRHIYNYYKAVVI